MKLRKLIIALFNILLVLLCSFAAAEIIGRSGNGYLETNGTHLILHLKGTPYEMGYQHGQLLKKEIGTMFDEYLKKGWDGSTIPRKNMIRVVKKYMKNNIPLYLMEEMQGMADATGIELDTIVFMQSFLDILSLFWSKSERAINYLYGGCSSFAARGKATEGGILIHARNIDFADKKILRKYTVLFVYEPDEGHKMTIPGWAGTIGALSGMNDVGVTLSEDTISTVDDDLKGTPFMLLLRHALQNSGTANDLKEIIKSAKRTTGYLVLTTSPEDQQIFLMEFNPGIFAEFQPAVEPCGVQKQSFCGVDDIIFGTNHPGDEDMKKVYVGSDNSYVRYNRWEQLVKEYYGKFNVDILKLMLSDNYNIVEGKITEPCNNTICTEDNIQSIIMLPEKKEFYLSQGTVPAAQGTFIHYSLDELFSKSDTMESLQK